MSTSKSSSFIFSLRISICRCFSISRGLNIFSALVDSGSDFLGAPKNENNPPLGAKLFFSAGSGNSSVFASSSLRSSTASTSCVDSGAVPVAKPNRLPAPTNPQLLDSSLGCSLSIDFSVASNSASRFSNSASKSIWGGAFKVSEFRGVRCLKISDDSRRAFGRAFGVSDSTNTTFPLSSKLDQESSSNPPSRANMIILGLEESSACFGSKTSVPGLDGDGGRFDWTTLGEDFSSSTITQSSPIPSPSF